MTKEKIDRLHYLDRLIRTRATGTPEQLAAKLGLSPSGWYSLRDKLVNEMGCPLNYDPYRGSYYYTENVKFEIGFKRLSDDEASDISGGAKLENFSHSTFSRVGLFSFALNL
jgi:hypothetical protein